jgi:predicted PurR-regulated permease PerM
VHTSSTIFLVLPIAERRIVHLAPALTIGTQLLLVGPAGIVGIMLAAPLAATCITLVRKSRAPQPAIDLVRIGEVAAPTKAGTL